MTRTTQRGGVLPLTRAGVWLLFVLAVLNGVFLYCFPSHADTDYAWKIVPPASAAFMGAGLVAGTLATGLVVFATTRWRSLQTLPWALWVLSATLAVATLVHHEKFKFDFAPTWAWVVIYVGIPFAVPYLVHRQRANADPEPDADAGLRTVRALSLPLGALFVIGAAILYLFPSTRSHWPWTLTPLLARVVAAWYAMAGTILLACALGLRRASEAVIPYATLALWSVLLLLVPLLHSDDVPRSGADFVIWTAVMVALLALSGLALARALPALRTQRL